jgi:Bacteroides conjugative transposon TraK protein
MEKTNYDVSGIVKTAGTITDSFRKLKFVTIACLVGAFVTAVLCVGYTMMKVDEFGGKIYVIDKGQAFMATRQDPGVTREDELKETAERFHTLFFTVTPNMDIVKANLEKAMRLCADRTAYEYYNDIQESGFYRRIAQAQAIQEVYVDSVVVDMGSYPYRVATFSSLYLTRPSLVVKNSLITRFSMIEVPRDASNTNGLKLEKFEVVKNEEVERRKRN